MPHPKSPVEKTTASSHSRRPGASRRSSSEKSVTQSSTASHKHGLKSGGGASSTSSSSPAGKTKDPMSGPLDLKGTPRLDGSGTDPIHGNQTDMAGISGIEGDTQQAQRGNAPQPTPPPTETKDVGFTYMDGRSEVPKSSKSSADEVQRLRAAVNAQIQLTQSRDKLAQQLGANASPLAPAGRYRVSPIHEETASPTLDAAFASPMPSAPETTSTESAKTVRGGTTPAPMAARTPSYPFPSMRSPGAVPFSGHRPFTTLSPTINPVNFAGGSFVGAPLDRVVSGSATPESTHNFLPPGSHQHQEDPNFPTPNLYELSLMLSTEPGLDAWWTTVVQLVRDIYKANKITLSVPADATDVENVPWGQKATFNVADENELSLTYLPRGSFLVPSSVGTNETSNSDDMNAEETSAAATAMLSPTRPGLLSRHSFTAYEDTKRNPPSSSEERVSTARPTPLGRAKSYLSARPDLPPRTATLQNAQLNLPSLEAHMKQEDNASSAVWETKETAAREVCGRVFPVLQALDYEADPLIDSSGVLRILERGTAIALTREYPYVENPSTSDEISGGSAGASGSASGGRSSKASTKSKDPASASDKAKREKAAQISSFLGGGSKGSRSGRSSARSHTTDKSKSAGTSAPEEHLHQLSKYEEYEQAPPSPWSQSPAASPAVRIETGENPFFTNATVDEETFNPNTSTPHDYTAIQPPEAIGVDRSWTILHIPLFHPILSRSVQSFRLDSAAMELKFAGRGKGNGNGNDATPKNLEPSKPNTADQIRDKQTPIAILSILSPVIPYPSNLRRSLEHLSPHLATSFSLCRHYSNLENELAGLSRKRPQTAGFGAVAPGSRTVGDRIYLGNLASSPLDENAPNRTAGSMTSPSDYSGMSRSAAGSPSGTSGWDPSVVGLTLDKRSSGESPGFMPGESYFHARTRPNLSRADTGTASSVTGPRPTSKELVPPDSRLNSSRSSDERPAEHEPLAQDTKGGNMKSLTEQEGNSTATSTSRQETLQRGDSSEIRDFGSLADSPISTRRQAMSANLQQGQAKPDRTHTQLHSYGADFGATFQSLPTTTAPPKPAMGPKTLSRTGSLSTPSDMPPPSDRLKGLMLDSLPAHVFVALPPTGEIVWVNNRYLTYRGQTVSELYDDPWGSIHPSERDEYLKAWAHALRTGEQFSKQVRIRRFDGNYRWFYTRAVGSRDIRGVIVQWYGSHMDIHDQHIAEVKAARQEEIEASEAKHRQLANLIPQIIFSATEDEGINFCNEQWLSYTGQSFEDAMGLGFIDYIHPEDLARCNIPLDKPPTPTGETPKRKHDLTPLKETGARRPSLRSSATGSEAQTETTVKGIHQTLSRNNSSSNGSVYELTIADLSELARKGVVKASKDSNGRLSYTTEVRLRSKDGEYRWHLVRCAEVDNISFGSGDGSWFGACTDINEHKLLEAKLKEAMDSKGKFLSNMSHEIRTPLIGISGMINFLQDTELDNEQSDYATTIQTSASSLLNIINDILDLSKVDAGMMKLSNEWFHTRSMVEEVNEMVSTMAITKRLELNYIIDLDVPEMLKGDKFRIRQVLLNVVGNAIKFTTFGEVFSRIRVVKDGVEDIGKDKVKLEFSVIDTGSGFTQEEADLIFKPFSQIDGSSTRQHGGSGLGLVISRQLVELHGGKMEGSAVPGQGSTFVFTAVFGLATADDYPEPPLTPLSGQEQPARSPTRSVTNEVSAARALKQAGGNPMLASKLMQSPLPNSPKSESSLNSPAALSSGSSVPSVSSARSRARSSSSSVALSLVNFADASRVGGPDLSKMKFALPERHGSASSESIADPSLDTTPTPGLPTGQGTIQRASSISEHKRSRPPMYSILLVCPQTHSREATTQHIENTLPKDVPHQITPLSSVAEAQNSILGEDSVIFTHIVMSLGSAEDIVALIEQITTSPQLCKTFIIILSDPVQRQEVIRMAAARDYEQPANDKRVTFIYKPVKPSRFAVIFDPDKERLLSTDRTRSNAQQQVANQKQNYLDVGKRLGNRGLRILLVEDNVLNQKVLLKYLAKVGIDVELASDGVECLEKVISKPHSFYSLILCDLHMPRKDGYQACREIREWEEKDNLARMPIIALSANVMADVLEKCVEAGFSSYVTKPVDFKALSNAMSDLLDPDGPETPNLMK